MKRILTFLAALLPAIAFGAGQAVTVNQNSAHQGTFNTAGVTSYVIGQPVTFTGGTTFNPLPIQASVTTIALLRSYTVTSAIVNGSAIQVTGYYAPNDGGGGVYVWNSTSTTTDNGGTVIQSTGVATGRWVLQNTSVISVKQFGAKGDGVTNDAAAIQAAVNAASCVYVPAATYVVSTPITLKSNFLMYGDGTGTIIKATTEAFYGYITNNLRLVGFSLVGPGASTVGSVGIFLDSLQPNNSNNTYLTDFYISGFETGIKLGSVGADQNAVVSTTVANFLITSCTYGVTTQSTTVDDYLFLNGQISAGTTGFNFTRSGFGTIQNVTGYGLTNFVSISGPAGVTAVNSCQAESTTNFLKVSNWGTTDCPIILNSCVMDSGVALSGTGNVALLKFVGCRFANVGISGSATDVKVKFSACDFETAGPTINLTGGGTTVTFDNDCDFRSVTLTAPTTYTLTPAVTVGGSPFGQELDVGVSGTSTGIIKVFNATAGRDGSIYSDATNGGLRLATNGNGYPIQIDGSKVTITPNLNVSGEGRFGADGTIEGLIRIYNGSASGKEAVLYNDSGGLHVATNGNSYPIQLDGSGVTLGTPTGGAKGIGTLNVAGGVYLNGTAYTNPDYVLEKWATGKVVRYAAKPGAKSYAGLRPLAEVERDARRTLHLQGFGQKAKNDLFSGSDALLARVEEAYLYLFDHEHRITSIEWQLRATELAAAMALLLGIRANLKRK